MRKDQKSLSHFKRALGFVCLTIVIFAGCEKKAAMAYERSPAPVSVVASVAQDVPVYLDEIGKCVAREVVTVQPQISGRIMEIHFTEGANIKTGDPLFTIDSRPFEADLQRAEAN